MDELTALALAVGRTGRYLAQRDGAPIEHGGIHPDRAAGVVLIEAVDVWGQRARLETVLREQGYPVETRHLIGQDGSWQIRVSPAPRAARTLPAGPCGHNEA